MGEIASRTNQFIDHLPNRHIRETTETESLGRFARASSLEVHEDVGSVDAVKLTTEVAAPGSGKLSISLTRTGQGSTREVYLGEFYGNSEIVFDDEVIPELEGIEFSGEWQLRVQPTEPDMGVEIKYFRLVGRQNDVMSP
jgi:hypothetical protein